MERSKLVVITVVVASIGGGVLLSLPAIPGPSVQVCLAPEGDGARVTLTPQTSVYVYAATEAGEQREVVYTASHRGAEGERTDVGVVPTGKILRLMVSRAPILDPLHALFRDAERDWPVPVSVSANGVAWDELGTLPDGCTITPFARRTLGWRYALKL